MGKRIVIALGGNALGKNLHEQMDAVHVTAKAIADLIEDGHEVVIAHGNGPQVGMIQNAFAAYHKQEAKSDIMPLSVCVATCCSAGTAGLIEIAFRIGPTPR